MAFLMIILLYAIVFQLSFGTKADLRVTENDVITTQMDMAIESALQEVFDRLKQDAEAAASSQTSGGNMGGDPSAAGAGAAAGGQEQTPASDSREDSWGRPQRSTIGEIELRVLVQDEDSKINLLQMLVEDEELRDEAFERVVRVIDMCRDGSTVDIDRSDAIRIAESIREHLSHRDQSVLARPKLASDDEEQRDLGMPLTFKEFEVLERLDERLFRDFRDERGYIVHSLGSYLTVWTCVTRGPNASDETESGSGGGSNDQANAGGNPGGQPGAGDGAGSAGEPSWGVCVNVNTAPVGVLKALVDDRKINSRFWDAVVEYRNLEEKEKLSGDGSEEEETAKEPTLDEYGNEVVTRQFFDSLDELSEVDGYERLGDEEKDQLSQLLSTQSHVFSIFVTARKKTGTEEDFGGVLGAERQHEREDLQRKGQVRTVRSVVWRYKNGDEVRIVPIVRWEVLDYTPFEVQDYPDEDR
jgi:hypothetical protein